MQPGYPLNIKILEKKKSFKNTETGNTVFTGPS